VRRGIIRGYGDGFIAGLGKADRGYGQN